MIGADPEALLLSAAWAVVEVDCDFIPRDGINRLLVRGANPSPVPIADTQQSVKVATVWSLIALLPRFDILVVQLR